MSDQKDYVEGEGITVQMRKCGLKMMSISWLSSSVSSRKQNSIAARRCWLLQQVSFKCEFVWKTGRYVEMQRGDLSITKDGHTKEHFCSCCFVFWLGTAIVSFFFLLFPSAFEHYCYARSKVGACAWAFLALCSSYQCLSALSGSSERAWLSSSFRLPRQ